MAGHIRSAIDHRGKSQLSNADLLRESLDLGQQVFVVRKSNLETPKPLKLGFIRLYRRGRRIPSVVR